MNRTPHPESALQQRAFTLLEVLVALMLFGTSALGLSMLVVQALAAANVAALQGTATMLLADARELAAVELLDAPAIARWQTTVAATLPAPADPLSAATVQTDPLDLGGRRRFIALRWAEPGYRADRAVLLSTLSADWRP
jgi:prepilin-type N-terminal cleavage/methylation domain-containing protein